MRNPTGDNKEYRNNYMRWMLRDNKHIKSIKEEFLNGNNWIIIDFDCKYSRKETSDRKIGVWRVCI